MKTSVSMNRRDVLRRGLGLAAVAATPGLFACAATAAARKGFFAEHGLPIGIQLYMLGEAAKADLDGTLERVASIGYRAIELPGIRADDAKMARAAANKFGLQITSVHAGASRQMANGNLSLQDDTAQFAQVMRTLGCKDVVLPFPLLPEVKPKAGEDMMAAMRSAFRTSTDHWKRTAALLNERGKALRDEGLSLSYHNHDMEFIRVGETSGWEILAAQTDPALVSFEIDVAWVVAGGQDPVTFIEGLAGRVRALHVKDLHRPSVPHEALTMDSTEVGNGVVDWKKVLPAAYRAGVRQFYVEQEPPFKIDRFEAAARSYVYLNQL